MALRLGSIVTCGEIINLRRNCVYGWLALRGQEDPIRLSLTGNCEGDLAGKYVRFEVRDDSPARPEGNDEIDLSRIAWEQVGPTGTMTVRPVSAFDGSTEEYILRSKLGEPPPTQWKNSLYLEWFSQNGRVVLEIVDPQLEFVDPNAKDEPALDELDPEASGADLEAERAAGEENDEPDASPWDDENPGLDDDECDDEPEDPYGLFPEELEAQFEEDAFATDRAILPPGEQDEFHQHMELYDEVGSSSGVPIREIFDPPMRIYRADDLDDKQVAIEFNKLLMRLARHGIALDMCEHYTPRQAYRLLVETILVEERTYPGMASTRFVQHYMTHEHCAQCEAELNAKYEAHRRERKEQGEADPDSPVDDIPF